MIISMAGWSRLRDVERKIDNLQINILNSKKYTPGKIFKELQKIKFDIEEIRELYC